MKKITLVLCACAIAFAGLLVSCSNDAGSEEIIFRSLTTNEYAYLVSGSVVTTFEDADDPDTLKETTVTTKKFSNVMGSLKWSENDDYTSDYKNYTFRISGCKGNVVEKYTQSGSNKDSSQDYERFTDYTDVSDKTISFYSLGDAFFKGTIEWDNSNQQYNVAAKTDDTVKALTETVKVTGITENPEEAETITIVYTVVEDELASSGYTGEDSVYKTTTVYTYNLVKADTAE